MMNPDRDLVFCEAREAIHEAMIHHTIEPNGTIDRIYSVMMSIVRVYLSEIKIDCFSHTAMIRDFYQHFIQPGLVPTSVYEQLVLIRNFMQQMYGQFESPVKAPEAQIFGWISTASQLVGIAQSTPVLDLKVMSEY